MNFTPAIYKSEPGKHDARFTNHERIQSRIEQIALEWAKYLQLYVKRTQDLFGEPQAPWKNTERAIVSTLASAVIRRFPKSFVLEESSVVKPGRTAVRTTGKAKDWGRCDLWVSIEDDDSSDFNFYLEAKMCANLRDPVSLKAHFRSRYGLSKIFRDYMKLSPRKARPAKSVSRAACSRTLHNRPVRDLFEADKG